MRLATVMACAPIDVLEMDTSEFRASVTMLARVDARIIQEREAGMPGRR